MNDLLILLYHQWQANLRMPGTDEIKPIPHTPLSHPFVERLIGTIRREFLGLRLHENMPSGLVKDALKEGYHVVIIHAVTEE